ncbi:MAG: hypothetical protein R3B06_21665 [Kofleriaceae bacterium]
MKHALLLPLLVAAACGSSSKPSTGGPATDPVTWKDMNGDQRHAFMESTVLPHMKEKFVAFDAADFGEMNCKTCHGEGAEDGSFEMPNPGIKPLDFGHMDQLDEHEQKVAAWMHEVVVPEMAALLGEQPYDPATQQGFGCLGCHTMVTSK